MGAVRVIGLDPAKGVLQVHGADASGRVVIRERLRRAQVLEFSGRRPRCAVAMEACSSAHVRGRELAGLGHEVRLVPPAHVKPFVKRQKNDMADAEAIAEAARRPTMRFGPVRSEEGRAAAAIVRTRDLLVRQRTPLIDAWRGPMGEFGLVAPPGISQANRRIAMVGGPDAPLRDAARSALAALVRALEGIEVETAASRRRSCGGLERTRRPVG